GVGVLVLDRHPAEGDPAVGAVAKGDGVERHGAGDGVGRVVHGDSGVAGRVGDRDGGQDVGQPAGIGDGYVVLAATAVDGQPTGGAQDVHRIHAGAAADGSDQAAGEAAGGRVVDGNGVAVVAEVDGQPAQIRRRVVNHISVVEGGVG